MASVNAWRLWNEHWEHVAHEGPIEERTEYPYQNIRTKNYFWGDGDKVGPMAVLFDWVTCFADECIDPFLEPQGQLPQARRGIDICDPRSSRGIGGQGREGRNSGLALEDEL